MWLHLEFHQTAKHMGWHHFLMEKRCDSHTALLIDTILHTASMHGIYLSARALYRAGIPLEVAVRLSNSPRERRQYWQPALSARKLAPDLFMTLPRSGSSMTTLSDQSYAATASDVIPELPDQTLDQANGAPSNA